MNKIIKLYIILLVFHIAHVYEEVVTNFIMRQKLGTEGFLLLNLFLFLIPLILLYFLIKRKKIGLIAAIIYPAIMVLNGILHIIMLIATGKYHDGYGGAVTGIFLIITGLIMLNQILKIKPLSTRHHSSLNMR